MDLCPFKYTEEVLGEKEKRPEGKEMPDLHPTKVPSPELRAGCPRCAQSTPVGSGMICSAEEGRTGKDASLRLLQSQQMSALLKGINTSGQHSCWVSLDSVFQTPCRAEPCPGMVSQPPGACHAWPWGRGRGTSTLFVFR